MENKKFNSQKPNRPVLPIGSKLFDSDYIVERYLMSGGMSSDIYIVHHKDKASVKLVAKIIYKKSIGMTDEVWNRVHDEAITAFRAFNQPNLVQTYDKIEYDKDGNDPRFCMIMEYVEGLSLSQYLAMQGCLIPKVALPIFLKVLNGIKILHSFKDQVIHRDLKPANIMLSYDLSKVTILDFGIATVIDRSEQFAENGQSKFLNDEQHPYGTPQYIAPDVIGAYKNDTLKYNRITVQVDFFSLGVILYEMLIGQKPFDTSEIPYDENDDKWKTAVIRLPLQYDMMNISANPSIPVSLENIIFRCIASRPEDKKFRYNNIDEIINDVETCLKNLNKNDNKVKLLKPVSSRMYQKAKKMNIERIKSNQKWYKHWWFFAVVVLSSIVILTICILAFFVW